MITNQWIIIKRNSIIIQLRIDISPPSQTDHKKSQFQYGILERVKSETPIHRRKRKEATDGKDKQGKHSLNIVL